MREKNRGDAHRGSHSNAVSGCEIGGGLEVKCYRDAAQEQSPINGWDIDLSFAVFAGVKDSEARHKAEHCGLLDDREHTCNEGLRSDNRGDRGDSDIEDLNN